MKAWMRVLLHENDTPPILREKCSNSGSGGASANYQDLAVPSGRGGLWSIDRCAMFKMRQPCQMPSVPYVVYEGCIAEETLYHRFELANLSHRYAVMSIPENDPSPSERTPVELHQAHSAPD